VAAVTISDTGEREPATPAPGHARPVTDRARPPRPSSKPNGQWKIDGTAPLNANEEWKQEDGGLAVRERIENTYAQGGFASIDPTDLHGRFRWWGLYTQRKPGIDGGRTATLEPHELEDEYFMLRVRIDGGQLTTEQLRVIAGISTEFGRDTADVTDRQNIQLHWIRVEDVPEIWRRLESVGLQTTEACGDVPRVILGSPVAGIAADEIIDPTPQIQEITERFIGDPSLANLPRKFKTAITGHPSQDVVHEINDVAFVGIVHPELGPGYDLWVGGALSTTPRLGERLGTFVAPDRVAEVWHGVTQIFRDYGYRRLRNKARLKFLLAEWGTEKFRQVLETEYLDAPLPDGPAAPKPTSPGDHVGIHRQKDGRFFVGVTPLVGRSSGSQLTKLADLVEAHGSTRVRTTPHQKLVILDIEEDRIPSLVAGLDALGLSSRPNLFRRSTIACTGIEFCKLAIVETKVNAAAAIEVLEERLAGIDLPHPISLHVNGCPNSCARIQTADIGLKGQLVVIDDEQVPGYQVHLGGGLASPLREEPGLGRTVRGLKVAADGIADYVERVVRRFLADREADETFAEWAHRAEEEALQ
jgi:sulfite reductase (ferredoxin)